MHSIFIFFFFFFNDTATTEIYTLSLHDALPICRRFHLCHRLLGAPKALEHLTAHIVDRGAVRAHLHGYTDFVERSEEHTSELQSRLHLVCRLLLEKKKK